MPICSSIFQGDRSIGSRVRLSWIAVEGKIQRRKKGHRFNSTQSTFDTPPAPSIPAAAATDGFWRYNFADAWTYRCIGRPSYYVENGVSRPLSGPLDTLLSTSPTPVSSMTSLIGRQTCRLANRLEHVCEWGLSPNWKRFTAQLNSNDLAWCDALG